MRSFLTAVLFCFLPLSAPAQDLDLLKGPGTIALMRHALAPGTGDPANFELRDCSTQRNLNDVGRDQARRIGKIIRDAGISFDLVWTSQWCRCAETAELLELGDPEEKPALNSFFQARDRADRQTDDTLRDLAELPADTRAFLVTHQVNITALTGEFASSGEIIVTRLAEDGSLEVTGRIEIAP